MGRAYGLRGAFYVSGRDEPIPPSYRELLIGASPETARPAAIKSSLWQSDRALLVCSLAHDKTSAELLTNQWIYVEAARVRPSTGSGLLWGDLEEADVVGKDGVRLGRIHALYNAGASDIAEVRDATGRSVDIPLVPDFVDVSQSTATPEGRVLRLLVDASTFDEVWQERR